MFGIFRRPKELVFPKGIEGAVMFTKRQMDEKGLTFESIVDSLKQRGEVADTPVSVTIIINGDRIKVAWYVSTGLINSERF